MNDNKKETIDDLLASKDYYIMNTTNLVVILFVKNDQQVAFSLNMVLDLMLVIGYAANLF